MTQNFYGTVTVNTSSTFPAEGLSEGSDPIDVPRIVIDAGTDSNRSRISILDRNSKPSISINGDGHQFLMIEPLASGGYGAFEINVQDRDRATVTLGTSYGGGRPGYLEIYDTKSRSIILDGKNGYEVLMDTDEGKNSIILDGKNAFVRLNDSAGHESITLDGERGDILLNNADCAEEFDISDNECVEPGDVMIINEDGRLQKSRKTYDKRAAGVISGAGVYKPGLVLDKKQSHSTRKSISLMGKVYCKVDSRFSRIEVGDLLTTSSTSGHAMKAKDQSKAFGTVIGKALAPLHSGVGMIPILIALQ